MRDRIARETARIMVGEGTRNLSAARAKAMRRLGLERVRELPQAEEIEEALRDYQMLFGKQQHLARLEKLRQVAVDAMVFFEPFQPRLVGSVLDGTVTELSKVTLHLFDDSPEEVAFKLQNHGIPFRLLDARVRSATAGQQTCPAYGFYADDVEIEALVFPHKELRRTPTNRSSAQKGSIRAPLREVERLLQETRVSA